MPSFPHYKPFVPEVAEIKAAERKKNMRLEISTKILIAGLNNIGENTFTDLPDRAIKIADRLMRLNEEFEPDMNLVDADCLTKIADALKEIETLILRINDLWKKFLSGNPKNP